ncbi:MAG: hypothetical protein K6F44_03300 [Lachnospiraceae bacterium]|nr:hypothetical protein [Lachnospiraceae bacterium]
MNRKLEKIFSAYHYAGGYELFFKTGAFAEHISDEYDGRIPELYPNAAEVLKLIREAADADLSGYERIAGSLEDIRKEVEAQMRGVVELRDNLAVCEYVLKRVCEPEPEKSMDVDREASAIISLIFRTKDSVAIRESVKAAVASLPLRIAKSRFFDIVENALETQLGRTEQDIDDIVSNIEGFAGLKVSGGDASVDRDASEVVDILFGTDLETIPAAELETIRKRAEDAAERIRLRIDALSDIGLMINSALLELTAAKHIGKGAGDVFTDKNVTMFIKKLLDAFEKGDKEAFDEGLVYEGIDESELEKLEELRLKIPGYEDGFIAMAGDEGDDISRDAKRCVTLISDSIFGSLGGSLAQGKTVDKEMIILKAKELKDRLTQSFASGSKLLQRARMSGVLSKLPLFLNDSDEVKDYVKSSLSSCRDEKEKAVAVRELKEFFAR